MSRKQAIVLVFLLAIIGAAGLGLFLSERGQPDLAAGRVSSGCAASSVRPPSTAAYMDLAIDALWADCSELFYRSLGNMGRELDREGGNARVAAALRSHAETMDWDDFGEAMDRLRELTALNDPVIDELLGRVAEWEAARDGFITTVAFPHYAEHQGQYRFRVSSVAGGYPDRREGFFDWRPGDAAGEVLTAAIETGTLAASVTLATASDPAFLMDIRAAVEGVAGTELARVENVVLNNLEVAAAEVAAEAAPLGRWQSEFRVASGPAADRALRHLISVAITFGLVDGRHAILEFWFNPEEHFALWDVIAERLR